MMAEAVLYIWVVVVLPGHGVVEVSMDSGRPWRKVACLELTDGTPIGAPRFELKTHTFHEQITDYQRRASLPIVTDLHPATQYACHIAGARYVRYRISAPP